MSKKRMIDTRFWHDSWIRKLNALDRYLFLYLITNDKCSFCGIYELPASTMAYECGIDEHDLETSMLPRLEPKVYYKDGWVYLPNFKKHHVSDESKNSLKGYDNAMKEVPQRILELFGLIDKPLQAPSSPSNTIAIASAISTPDSNESDLPIKGKKMYEYQPVDEDGNPRRRKSSGKGKEVKARNAELIKLGFLFEKLGEQSTGIKPDLSKSYFILKNAQEKCGVDDFESLFKYFFSDSKLQPEQKVSLAFCCSPSYITQWKVHQKNKPVSQAGLAHEIRL